MMNNRDWRTDDEKAADIRDRPYLIAEAWSYAALMAAGLVLVLRALLTA